MNGSCSRRALETAGSEILRGVRKESSREQTRDFRGAFSFCSQMIALGSYGKQL